MSTFEGKDAAEMVQGYWIIEAGELTGFNRSEMNAVKQFLSKKRRCLSYAVWTQDREFSTKLYHCRNYE